MRTNKATLVLGIIYGVSLALVAYLFLAIGIALAFMGDGILAYSCYIFAGLAVSTIVCSCFAKKNVIVSRVGLTISVAFFAFAYIYSIVIFIIKDALVSTSILYFLILAALLILGIVAMILSYKAKTPKKLAEQNSQEPTVA